MGDVVHSIPAPGFYSNGLAWDGSNLWAANIADAAHPDNDWYRIYQISPEDGEIISSIPTHPWFYHGLTFDGEYLWGEHNYTEIVRMSNDGSILQQIQVPPLSIGLACDRVNNILYLATTQPGMILIMDAATGLVLNELYPQEETDYGWGDLAFDGTNLWHSNVATDLIYQIDPGTGEILNQFEAPSGQCEGLTFDGWYLWASDTNLDLIYQIDIEYQPQDPCDEWTAGDVNLDSSVNILDVISAVNYILDVSNPGFCGLVMMDLNEDGSYNILDIISIVNIILGN